MTNNTPTLAGFLSFLRSVGFYAKYIPDDSVYIEQAYCLSLAQVNKVFAQMPGGIYCVMVYNLGADILINIAQDYSVPISSITWAANVATVVTASPGTFVSGDAVTINGEVQTPYNGTFQVTVTDSTHFTYPLTPNPGSNVMSGTAGFNFFQIIRKKWNIDSFVAGVIASSYDATTGETIATPDHLKQATINDLQNLKTPFGRTYLQYAEKFGTLWGIS